MTRRVLVTGGGGFVGRHACARLLAAGWQVRSASRRGILVPGAENVPFTGDGPDDMARLVHGCDAVVHAAARAHVLREFEPDPATAFRRDNVELTRHLATAAAAEGVEAFVFLSSIAAVTNAHTTSVSDVALAEPDTDYGRSKREAEVLLDDLARRSAMRVVALRPPMIYGEGMRGNPLRLFVHVWRGLPVPCVRPPVHRSVMYVGDVARAVVRVIERESVAGAYCIAGGRAVPVEHFVRTAAAELGRPARILPLPASLLDGMRSTMGLAGSMGRRTGDALGRLGQRLEVDEERFVQLTGLDMPLGLKHGLRLTAAWFRTGAAFV